VEGSEHNR